MTLTTFVLVWLSGSIVSYGLGMGSHWRIFGSVLGVTRENIVFFMFISLMGSWFSALVTFFVYHEARGFWLNIKRQYPADDYKKLYIEDHGEIQ